MSVVTVGGQAQRIESSYTGSFLVHNAGSSPAYLGTDSSLSVGSQSVTLVPGASLNWSGELWGIATAANPTTLEVALQGEGHSAPGPTSVSLSQPVSLAAGSQVGVSGGNVGVSGTVGALQQANPTLLYTNVITPFTFTTAAEAVQLINQTLVVGGYSSLLIVITGGYSNTTEPLNPANYIPLDISFPNYGTGTNYSEYTPQWLLDWQMRHTIQVPVSGQSVVITGSLVKALTGLGGSVYINVYGINTPINAPIYLSNSWNLKGSLVTGGYWQQLLSGANTITYYLASSNGAADFRVQNQGGTATQTAILNMADSGAVVSMAQLVPTPAGADSHLPVRLPLRPIAVTIYCYAGASILAMLMQ